MFEQLVIQSPNIQWVIHWTGTLVYANPATRKDLGYDPEGWSFKDLLRRVHPSDRRALWRCLSMIETQTSPLPFVPVRVLNQNNYWLQFNSQLSPLDWPHSSLTLNPNSAQPTFYALTLNPAISEGSTSFSASKANLSSLDANATKSHFLAIMSHELRTPINAITGFSQLLLRQRHDSLSPRQEDMVSRILTNGKNLLSLINDVLDLSKLEAGRMDLKIEAIDLENLVATTVKEIDSLATQGNLALKTRIRLNDITILNDRIRLRQILVNLLSNAIKFTENGGIWIIVEEVSSDLICISVQDSGPGIDKEHLTRVFQEFWQSDQTNSRKHSGTGLGLAICHNLVKMMQGDIQVHSQVGQGATFRLTIPRVVHQRSLRTTL